jgi:hypothetical protein
MVLVPGSWWLLLLLVILMVPGSWWLLLLLVILMLVLVVCGWLKCCRCCNSAIVFESDQPIRSKIKRLWAINSPSIDGEFC